ncbi:MAG: hypothetical protein JNL62_12780, partial [Bryobacterales bacterium]|nr:hypothetical protein [Bryobacterales bacterium]
RRFDSYGNPCLALSDVDAELLRGLVLDISAWRLAQPDNESALAADLGEAVS